MTDEKQDRDKKPMGLSEYLSRYFPEITSPGDSDASIRPKVRFWANFWANFVIAAILGSLVVLMLTYAD
jgi:hypothetical protein